MKISQSERDTIRELAKQQAEIAASVSALVAKLKI